MKKSIILTFMLFVLFSCVPHRKTVYFQKENPADVAQFLNTLNENAIQKGDELYIRVTSTDQESYNFMATRLDGMGMMGNQSISLISYSVSANGTIVLPVLGEVSVEGKTLDQAGKDIQNLLREYLNKPTVILKFVNRNVTLIGQVRNPGQFEFSHDRMNIIQAIGRAGDITEYGDRRKIILIREEENNIKQISLDITKNNIFSSPYYYVKPGDIIYVQPLKNRYWGISTVPFTLILSSVTTTILLLNYIEN